MSLSSNASDAPEVYQRSKLTQLILLLPFCQETADCTNMAALSADQMRNTVSCQCIASINVKLSRSLTLEITVSTSIGSWRRE